MSPNYEWSDTVHCFLGYILINKCKRGNFHTKPGGVARSEACPSGMQVAPSSIPTSGTFFRGDFVMKTFLRPFSLSRRFKKSSCQLLAKEYVLSTGKQPRRLAQGRKTEISPKISIPHIIQNETNHFMIAKVTRGAYDSYLLCLTIRHTCKLRPAIRLD